MSKDTVKFLLLVILVFTASYGITFVVKIALATDSPMVVVEGVSMIPTYYEGDLLIINGGIDKSEIEPQKDIIVYHSPNDWDELIVHRVYSNLTINNQLYFIAKGDNNFVVDPFVIPEKNVVGVVIFRVPSLGNVVFFAQSLAGRLLLMVVIVAIVISILFKNDERKILYKGENLTRISFICLEQMINAKG